MRRSGRFLALTRSAGVIVLSLFAAAANSLADEPARPAVAPRVAPVPGVVPAGRTMRVCVVDPDGKPLSGAKVHASIWEEEPKTQRQDHLADQEGVARIALPKQVTILRIWASQAGHVPMFAQWWPEKETRPRPIPAEFTFQLDRGVVIGGRVTDEEGRPVPQARVSVRLVEPQRRDSLEVLAPIPNTWLATESESLTTDAEGRWSLGTAPAEGTGYGFDVMLNHPDYVSDYIWGGLRQRQGVTNEDFRNRTATIAMRRGCRLSGVVTDPQGRPVSEAIVIWGDDPYNQQGSQEVATDAQGLYAFPPLSESNIRVTVVAKGWAPEEQRAILEGEAATCDFRVKAGRTLRFQFVDETGTPVPKVSVSIAEWRRVKALYNHRHPNVLTTPIPREADSEGIYEWKAAPADEVRFNFYKTGYESRHGVAMVPVEDSEYVVPLRRIRKGP